MKLWIRVCVVLLISILVLFATHSQTTCSTPPTNASETLDGLQQALPANTNVTVYFDSTQFDAADIAAMEKAFTDWQSADSGSGTTFSFVVLAGPPPATGTFITVGRDSSLDPSTAMNTTTQTTNKGSYDVINNANIAVNTALINDPSMEQK